MRAPYFCARRRCGDRPKPLYEFTYRSSSTQRVARLSPSTTCTPSKTQVFLKFDFLGIRNLSILSDAVRLVKRFAILISTSKKFLLMIPKRHLRCSPRGETMGLFQLNGAGMTATSKNSTLQPSTTSTPWWPSIALVRWK
jgi:hypothetical protein